MSMIKVQSLYQLAMEMTVLHCTSCHCFSNREYRTIPDHVLFDLYFNMFRRQRVSILISELRNHDVFARMLGVKHRRANLLQMFQTLVNHSTTIVPDLLTSYTEWSEITLPVIRTLLSFAVFLSEGSWYKFAHIALTQLEEIIRLWTPENTWQKKIILLNCLQRRLFVESNYSLYGHAEKSFNASRKLLVELEMEAKDAVRELPNFATVYANFAHFFTTRSEYDEAYKWGYKAIRALTRQVSKSAYIFVLRVVAKTCVHRRKYFQAHFLIQQALILAKEKFLSDQHPNYSDTLIVYGFFLLNYDNIAASLKFYKEGLSIRKAIFGKHNVSVALLYEELAYVHYASGYNSRGFQKAIEYANKAALNLERLLPCDHFLLSYTQRVKGLIIEEVALDIMDAEKKNQYLLDAEALHKSALQLALTTFGEDNVQTAKHYGNLGRLYQSLGRYHEAEKMQLLSISIKEAKLGPLDYEVGLSMSHLASLYNFHMHRYKDAEHYYLRSIDIALKLFGESYSGLEYDYRGLIRVYTQLQEPILLNKYTLTLQAWRARQHMAKPIPRCERTLPIENVVEAFLSW